MKHLNDFKKSLKGLGYKDLTIKMAIACVTEFTTYTGLPLKQIEPWHIMRYRDYLQMRPKRRGTGGLSENMINHHIYSLKLYFSYLMAVGKIDIHPMNTLRFPRPTSKQRLILTIQEIHNLYNACESYKEKALLGVYYGCGLRRSEGIRLTVKDVHFKDNLLYVRDGKGGKRRVVPMSNKVSEDIKNYILHERFNPKGEKALLLNQLHLKMSGDTACNLFHELVTRSGIDKEISLHNLRHSIATHLLSNGMSIEQVRDFLGHQCLESTQIYTRVLQKV